MPSSSPRAVSPGTVLVTGGAGFIGCALADRLAESADRWVVVDNLHPQVHESRAGRPTLHAKAELVVADVTDADDLGRRCWPTCGPTSSCTWRPRPAPPSR